MQFYQLAINRNYQLIEPNSAGLCAWRCVVAANRGRGYVQADAWCHVATGIPGHVQGSSP